MIVHLGIVACVVIFGSNGQTVSPAAEEPCSTTTGTQGVCIKLSECTPLLNLLMKPNLNAAELETLRNSQCGFEGINPKVCCGNETEVTTSTALPDVTNHPNLRLVNDQNCGALTEERILHGTRPKLGQFPWMVLIGYETRNGSVDYQCGGTLINKRYVLTAAHCVTQLGSWVKLSTVRVGEFDLNEDIDCVSEDPVTTLCAKKPQDFLIESYHSHSGYQKQTHQNDVAVIRLNGDVDFRPFNIGPICLPIGDVATRKLDKAIVTGWGTTESGIRSNVLLEAKLQIAPNDECARIYGEKHGIDITYKQLCAGGKDRTDTCTGDSGGPLQYPSFIDGLPKYVQHGVINFGPARCGVVGYPGVYLRVAYYVDWILDTIRE